MDFFWRGGHITFQNHKFFSPEDRDGKSLQSEAIVLQSQDLKIWAARYFSMDAPYLGITISKIKQFCCNPLVVVQVQLQCLKGRDLRRDGGDQVVGEVKQVQVGEVAESKREV